MPSKPRALAAATLVLVLALIGPAALGLDRGAMGSVSPDDPVVETTSPPMTGIYPAQGAPAHPFALFRPTTCRTASYCDTHEFTVEYPQSYLKDVLFGITVTLTWDDPRTEDDPTGNDLDLFVFLDDDDPVSGRPINNEKCVTPEDDPCNNLTSEQITIIEPAATGGELENPPYRATVVNHFGVNTGYELAVEWFTFELEAAPTFERPGGATTQATPEPRPEPAAQGPVAASTPSPQTTPRTILVPGPDGELVEVELPVLASGQRAQTDAEGRTSPWIPAAVVGSVVALVMGGFVVIRLRRDAQAL